MGDPLQHTFSTTANARTGKQSARQKDSHSAARKQSLKSKYRIIVPMLKAPRIGSNW